MYLKIRYDISLLGPAKVMDLGENCMVSYIPLCQHYKCHKRRCLAFITSVMQWLHKFSVSFLLKEEMNLFLNKEFCLFWFILIETWYSLTLHNLFYYRAVFELQLHVHTGTDVAPVYNISANAWIQCYSASWPSYLLSQINWSYNHHTEHCPHHNASA
jgi:hypothetical protein